MFHCMHHHLIRILGLGLLLSLTLGATPARAALDVTVLIINLKALAIQGNQLVTSMDDTTLNPSSMSSQLASIEARTLSYLGGTTGVYTTVAAGMNAGPISVTPELLTAIDNLAVINAALGKGLLELSDQLTTLSASTGTTVLKSSLATILRLSDDIGTMADRILEMADKILIMADNIGLMADRIVTTLTIQNANIKQVVDANLQTQTNIIKLVALLRL